MANRQSYFLFSCSLFEVAGAGRAAPQNLTAAHGSRAVFAVQWSWRQRGTGFLFLFPVVGGVMARQKSELSRVQGWRFFRRIQAKKYYPSLDCSDRRRGLLARCFIFA